MKAVYKLYLHLLKALILAPSDALWRQHVLLSPQRERERARRPHLAALYGTSERRSAVAEHTQRHVHESSRRRVGVVEITQPGLYFSLF